MKENNDILSKEDGSKFSFRMRGDCYSVQIFYISLLESS